MRSRRGMTIVELMVLVVILGNLIGLVLPAIQASRRTGHKVRCPRNLMNIGLGLEGYLNSNRHYPNAGTYRELPGTASPSSSTIFGCFTEISGVDFLTKIPPNRKTGAEYGPLRSWVVDILPFIDAYEQFNAWNKDRTYHSSFDDGVNPPNEIIASKAIGILTCAEDLTVQPGQGKLSYVVNGGFSRWVGDPSIGWLGTATGGMSTRSGPDWGIDVAAQTRVMFLGTDTGRAPWDRRTTDTSIVDGTSQTILASENLRAGFAPAPSVAGAAPTNWACPHPNVVMFIASDKICPGGSCPAGQTSPTLSSDPSTGKEGNAWSRANDPKTYPYESINPAAKWGLPEGQSPFPSSNHVGGVNVLFCDGSVRFIAETIDGSVYAKLITPAGSALPAPYRQLPLSTDEF